MISKKRVLTITIGLVVVFSILIFTPPSIFIVVTYLTALLAFNEFLWMYHIHENASLYRISISIFALLGMMFLFSFMRNLGINPTLIPPTLLSVTLLTKKPSEKKLEQAAVITMGTLYADLLFYYMALIRLMPHGLELTIVLCLGMPYRILCNPVK